MKYLWLLRKRNLVHLGSLNCDLGQWIFGYILLESLIVGLDTLFFYRVLCRVSSLIQTRIAGLLDRTREFEITSLHQNGR